MTQALHFFLIDRWILLETLKIYLEIISLCCGPIAALIAYRALNQLKIAKQNLHISSLRGSYSRASNRVDFYLSEIEPKLRKLKRNLKQNSIDNYQSFSFGIDISSRKFSDIREKIYIDDFENHKQYKELLELYLPIRGYLESFSICFVSGVADSDIGYNSIGLEFCETIQALYIFVGVNKQNAFYPNTEALYRKWYEKQAMELVRKEHANGQRFDFDLTKNIQMSPTIGVSKRVQ